MRFDAYCGNVQESSVDEVAQVLAWKLGGVIERGRGVRRCSEVLRVEHAGRCAVWVGRDSGNDCIYFEGKGETTPELAAAVRKHFPGHAVSRADVSEDYDSDGAFSRLVDVVRLNKGPRVYGGFVKLPDSPDEGRTWEAGKRKDSVSYVRIYEAGKMRERAHLGRPGWVRVELEAKPHYAADRQAAATMDPAHFWGLSAWAKRVAGALFEVDVPRYAVPVRAYDFHKTTTYIARTFRRHLETMLEDHGDAECVMREFRAVWHADDEARAAMQARPDAGAL